MNQPASNVTLKHPTGPWWTIYGTAGEIAQQIAGVFPHLAINNATDFPMMVAQASTEWATLVGATGQTPAQAPSQNFGGAQQGGGGFNGGGGGSAPAGKTCAHGAMTYRTGTKQGGKQWAAYFCPQPKGAPDQCSPEWV